KKAQHDASWLSVEKSRVIMTNEKYQKERESTREITLQIGEKVECQLEWRNRRNRECEAPPRKKPSIKVIHEPTQKESYLGIHRKAVDATMTFVFEATIAGTYKLIVDMDGKRLKDGTTTIHVEPGR